MRTLITVIIVLIVILALGFLVLQCGGGSCIKRIDKTLPETDDAPWEITTVTHLYYAKYAVVNSENSVTMTNWYDRVNGKWVYHKGEETLPELLKPIIKMR